MRKDLKANRMIGWEKTNSKKLRKIERKILEEKLSNLLKNEDGKIKEKKKEIRSLKHKEFLETHTKRRVKVTNIWRRWNFKEVRTIFKITEEQTET